MLWFFGFTTPRGAPAETAVDAFGQKRRFREANLLEENAAADQDVLKVAPFEIKTIKLALEVRPVR